MPRELRFCRNCGFRLGEGTAEYTETVRFQNIPGSTIPGNRSTQFPPQYGGMTVSPAGPMRKRKRRLSGMSWMFIGLLLFFVVAAGLTAIIRPARQGVRVEFATSGPRAMVGVNSFDTTEGGVTFGDVEPPGSPADKAGLVGGDVITTVDGHPVVSDDQMTEILSKAAIGQTFDIVYLRDGEPRTAKLTTISRAEMDQLNRDFRNRPEGRGQFGYEDGDAETVPIPNTKMHGVKLGEVLANRPADIAGVKAGDIVIEFDGVPIRTSEEFLSRVRRALPYSTVKLVVMRGEEKLEIPVKMGKQ
ncbi:MAG TPA: PDZ domain-containing protein [Pyrinomonadaceae bacterium]|nr:PDZ domain-containing protein [Pyrinomonadaceae bacterium]